VAVPAGKVLFIQSVIASFNVKPGMGGFAALKFTPLGGSTAATVDIPTHRSAPATQVAGMYDGYQGSVAIGLPTASTPEACVGGSQSDLSAEIIVLGTLVPAS
jgi:hypothetical protein